MSKIVYKHNTSGEFICSYATTTQAARDLSVDESTIRRAADNDRECKGFLWSRIKYPDNRYQKALEYVGIKGGWVKGGWESCIDNSGIELNTNSLIEDFNDSTPLREMMLTEPELITKIINKLYCKKEVAKYIDDRLLIIGDLHEPFCRGGYLEFCKEIYKKYNCTGVIFIGDILDNHFSSFHDTDADGHSAKEELRLAKLNISKWYEAFPIARVCLGNHDLIPNRKAFNAGLSKVWIKSIGEVLDTPNWEYAEEFIINNVLYTHGTGRKCDIRMQQDLISTVQGHYHSESYIKYAVGRRSKMFAMQTGCGVDDKSYAMAYGKQFAKNHINCGVVLENGTLPLLEYMQL